MLCQPRMLTFEADSLEILPAMERQRELVSLKVVPSISLVVSVNKRRTFIDFDRGKYNIDRWWWIRFNYVLLSLIERRRRKSIGCFGCKFSLAAAGGWRWKLLLRRSTVVYHLTYRFLSHFNHVFSRPFFYNTRRAVFLLTCLQIRLIKLCKQIE